MAENINATCSICGRGYHMCLSCKDHVNLNPWKKFTDTSEHYKIYQILRGYNTKLYTKEEAKSKLQMVDLSDFDILRDNIKNIIKDIMGEDEKMVDAVVDTNTEAANLSNESDVSNDNVENNVVFEKSNISRKRKSFKVVEME